MPVFIVYWSPVLTMPPPLGPSHTGCVMTDVAHSSRPCPTPVLGLVRLCRTVLLTASLGVVGPLVLSSDFAYLKRMFPRLQDPWLSPPPRYLWAPLLHGALLAGLGDVSTGKRLSPNSKHVAFERNPYPTLPYPTRV